MKLKPGPAEGQRTLFDFAGVSKRARVEGEGFVPIEVRFEQGGQGRQGARWHWPQAVA